MGIYIYLYLCYTAPTMTQLPYTAGNVALIQEFLDETKKRIAGGIEVTITRKANEEPKGLSFRI